MKKRNRLDNHYKVIIKVCWVTLICYLAFKIFGLETVTSSYSYMDFCIFVDSNLIIKMSLAALFYVGQSYFIVCILIDKRYLDKKKCCFVLPLLIFKSIIGWHNIIIATIIDIFILIVMPLIIYRQSFIKVIIVNVLILLYQLLSIYIKDMNINFNNSNNFLTQSLYMFDYYIMIILHYLYYFKNKES